MITRPMAQPQDRPEKLKPNEGGTTDDVSDETRPPDDDPYQRREFELEEEKLRRSLSIEPSKLVK